MTGWMMLGGAVLALAVGLWIGFGAPGVPLRERLHQRSRLEKRPINPIAWGRSGADRRERPSDRWRR